MTFTAPTREEAHRLAEEYMKTVDEARQPWISGDFQSDTGWIVVVRERGLD